MPNQVLILEFIGEFDGFNYEVCEINYALHKRPPVITFFFPLCNDQIDLSSNPATFSGIIS